MLFTVFCTINVSVPCAMWSVAMDLRVTTIGIIVVTSTSLAVRGVAPSFYRLVATDVEPCSVAEDGSTSAKCVGDDVHGATLVLADRVL